MITHSRILRATILMTLITAPLAGVVTLAAGARTHHGLAGGLDPHVAADILHVRNNFVTQLAQLLTFLGGELVIGTLTLALIITLLEGRGPYYAGLAAAAMSISASVTVGTKLAVERTRPGPIDRLGAPDPSSSFPSGHTLNSATFFGLVIILLIPLIHSRSTRIAATIAATTVALGVGASRVYLGYHWTSDVLASWLIATFLLTLVVITARRRSAPPDTRLVVERTTAGTNAG